MHSTLLTKGSVEGRMYLHFTLQVCNYIYMCVCACVCVLLYIYIYIERERERENIYIHVYTWVCMYNIYIQIDGRKRRRVREKLRQKQRKRDVRDCMWVNMRMSEQIIFWIIQKPVYASKHICKHVHTCVPTHVLRRSPIYIYIYRERDAA